jgi:glycosyltransferase involved in cell wall biosynthesis
MEQQGVDFEIIESMSEERVSYNFNRGLEQAQGEYCKFVAEDDWLPPGALKALRDGIKDRPWIFANAIQMGPEKWTYRPGDYSKDFMIFRENLQTNRIHGGTTLYRTEILREIGGMDEDLWTGEEYDMHLKLWSNGYVPGYIDAEVYCHRIWGGQKSRRFRQQNKNLRDEAIKTIQARYNDSL